MVAANLVPPPAFPPAPDDLPGARELLEAWDRVPLQLALVAFRRWPLRSCPRPSCSSTHARAIGQGWACLSCGALGGPGAYVAGLLYDWGFDQVQELLRPAGEWPKVDDG